MAKLTPDQWEVDRAREVMRLMRQVNVEGVIGNDVLAEVVNGAQYPSQTNAPINEGVRRLAYALLGALSFTPEWLEITDFQNNWVSLGNDFSHKPAVMMDPFGFVHWRGLVGRSSGVAVNGETICHFPSKFMPARLSGYPCITNSGLIHVGVFNDGPNGLGRLAWRTTGGFTGGYGFVYLDNIGVYDTRA